MSYKPMRGYVPQRGARLAARERRDAERPVSLICWSAVHAVTRQGDEMACACGKRWPVGEDHP